MESRRGGQKCFGISHRGGFRFFVSEVKRPGPSKPGPLRIPGPQRKSGSFDFQKKTTAVDVKTGEVEVPRPSIFPSRTTRSRMVTVPVQPELRVRATAAASDACVDRFKLDPALAPRAGPSGPSEGPETSESPASLTQSDSGADSESSRDCALPPEPRQ